MNSLQALPSGLGHIHQTHQSRKNDRNPKQVIRSERAIVEENRCYQRHDEVGYPIRALSETTGRCSGLRWLDLGYVELEADAPGDGVADCEEVDCHDDDPTSGTLVLVDAAGCVEGTDEEHAERHGNCAPEG